MQSRSEEQYFIRVFRESYTSILSYITSKCSDRFEIEDLVQEVYTEFYLRIKRHGFNDIDNPIGFLMTIAKRKLVRYYKKKKQSFIMQSDIQNPFEDDSFDEAEVFSLENEVINKILLEKVWNEIAFEGPTVLRIFKMRHYKDMTFKQISAELGLSKTTVINNYYKALNKIKKNYMKEEEKK